MAQLQNILLWWESLDWLERGSPGNVQLLIDRTENAHEALHPNWLKTSNTAQGQSNANDEANNEEVAKNKKDN